MTIAVPSSSYRAEDREPSLREVLRRRLLRVEYQPLVDLATTAVVGYEALARGPEGTPLETPAALFAAAAGEGLTFELDWACREAALRGALEAALHRSRTLFVNGEPSSFARPAPPHVRPVLDFARTELTVVTEITERAITDAPAALLAQIERIRRAGGRLAIDDVGVDPRSLALLPFVMPEVVKLDMAVVQTDDLAATARIATAVRAHAERTGCLIVAEGIETPAHHDTALALGAHVGQGWRFGRPGPLPRSAAEPVSTPLRLPSSDLDRSSATPFELLSAHRQPRRGTKDLLFRMSRALELQVAAESEASVVLSTFQEASFFTPATARLYRDLATRAALVGALGVGLPEEPAPGVRGASLWRTEPLRGEWDVCAVGPFQAGAFAAKDLGDRGPDGSRRFDFVMTHDRDLVVAAARSLLTRVTPSG